MLLTEKLYACLIQRALKKLLSFWCKNNWIPRFVFWPKGISVVAVTRCQVLSNKCCPSSAVHQVLSNKCCPSSAVHQVLSIMCCPSSAVHQVLSIKCCPSSAVHYCPSGGSSVSYRPSSAQVWGVVDHTQGLGRIRLTFNRLLPTCILWP